MSANIFGYNGENWEPANIINGYVTVTNDAIETNDEPASNEKATFIAGRYNNDPDNNTVDGNDVAIISTGEDGAIMTRSRTASIDVSNGKSKEINNPISAEGDNIIQQTVPYVFDGTNIFPIPGDNTGIITRSTYKHVQLWNGEVIDDGSGAIFSDIVDIRDQTNITYLIKIIGTNGIKFKLQYSYGENAWFNDPIEHVLSVGNTITIHAGNIGSRYTRIAVIDTNDEDVVITAAIEAK